MYMLWFQLCVQADLVDFATVLRTAGCYRGAKRAFVGLEVKATSWNTSKLLRGMRKTTCITLCKQSQTS